jgi:hypothetical protein
VIGVFGLVAWGAAAYAYVRRRRGHAAAWGLLGALLVALETYARLHPAPAPTTELRLSREEQGSLRIQLAQSELRAAGFAVPPTGDAGEGVLAVDGNFSAKITPRGGAFRVERTGHEPLDGVTLAEAVAKILEGHTPKR